MHCSSPLFSRSPAALALFGVILTASPVDAQTMDPMPPPPAAAPTSDGVSTVRARSAPTFILYFENDYFGGTDQHYTNGLKLAWLTGDLNTWGQTGWRRSFVEALPFVNREGGQKNFAFAIGQNIYTPDDIDAVNPDPTDRPYAGWTYAELSFLSKTDTVADTLVFQVGMVGPHSYADDTQRLVHEWINDSRPNGWEYQIGDELGVNIVYERKWRTFARSAGNGVGIDFIPHLGASVGNVATYANAGAMLRMGFNLPSDFGVNLIRPGGLTSGPIDDLDPRVDPQGGWSFFIFGGADGRAIARDIFLDGNTWKDSREVDKEPFVADLSYGFGLVRHTFQLTFTQVVRTREFETQASDHNDFGSVTLSWTF